jgi:hypothetical protein
VIIAEVADVVYIRIGKISEMAGRETDGGNL